MNPKLWLITAILLVSIHPAEAQEPFNTQHRAKLYRIGVIGNVRAPSREASPWSAFRQGLSERGWIGGRNVVIEYRHAEGEVERFPAFAAELVRLKVDLIVAISSQAVNAAKQATNDIPIVMVYAGDPVLGNLVSSLARPGANVTGLTFVVGPEIVGKYLELLKETVPKLSNVAVLFHEATQGTFLREEQAAANVLAVKVHPVEVKSFNDLQGAFDAMVRERGAPRLGAGCGAPEPYSVSPEGPDKKTNIFSPPRDVADSLKKNRARVSGPGAKSGCTLQVGIQRERRLDPDSDDSHSRRARCALRARRPAPPFRVPIPYRCSGDFR